MQIYNVISEKRGEVNHLQEATDVFLVFRTRVLAEGSQRFDLATVARAKQLSDLMFRVFAADKPSVCRVNGSFAHLFSQVVEFFIREHINRAPFLADKAFDSGRGTSQQ